jgi:D-methionine transport system ATP-binding protein
MIEVRNLCKAYAGQTVLQDVSFDVRAGEVFGIVGHSGAGKSTLLRCLNGLENYNAGSVKVMGREVASLPQRDLMRLRGKMGMVFQTFNLMARKNVFENVAFPLYTWGFSPARVRERVTSLLELVGLAGKSRERAQNLSGGQKQRVGIARALALEPAVLLCDEATSALDPKTTASILDLLESINRRLGLTVVMVTHQMEVVKRLCHRTLLLDGGLTQALDRTEDLFLLPPDNLQKLVDEEYTLIPTGVNIRVMFPRGTSRQCIVTGMAMELGLDFSIVGGRLERYLDEILGFLIINVDTENAPRVLAFLEEKKLACRVLATEEAGFSGGFEQAGPGGAAAVYGAGAASPAATGGWQ